jgi:hypothetical protein
MNKANIIDYALTDDVDFFVFRCVHLIQQKSATDDEISIYTAACIREHLCLMTNDLVLYAILTGGDYHPGLKGCGAVTAEAFASSGYASSLMTAFRAMAPRVFQDYVCDVWQKQAIEELKTNQHALFKTTHPEIAATLAADVKFPYPTVLSLYLNPVTSQLNPSQPPICPSFCGVSIDQLGNLCTERFGWNGEFLAQKFFNVVLPGAVSAIIYSVRIVLLFIAQKLIDY